MNELKLSGRVTDVKRFSLITNGVELRIKTDNGMDMAIVVDKESVFIEEVKTLDANDEVIISGELCALRNGANIQLSCFVKLDTISVVRED